MEQEYLDVLFKEYKRANGIGEYIYEPFNKEELDEFIEARKKSKSLLSSLMLLNMRSYPMIMEYNLGGLNTSASNITSKSNYSRFSVTTKYSNSYDKYSKILSACFNGYINHDTYARIITNDGKKIKLMDYADTIITDPMFINKDDIDNLIYISSLNTDVFFGINGILSDKDVSLKSKELINIKNMLLDTYSKKDVQVIDQYKSYNNNYAYFVRARKIKK